MWFLSLWKLTIEEAIRRSLLITGTLFLSTSRNGGQSRGKGTTGQSDSLGGGEGQGEGEVPAG
jgi:hypothetical protein